MPQIKHFIWDEGNISHLEQAHPHLLRQDLEDIVREASKFRFVSRHPRTGLKNFMVRRGRLAVVFTVIRYDTARIFSVRE